MKMIFERLIPGVQDRNNSNRSTQTAFAKLDKRFTDRFEQKTQDGFLVGENEPVKFVR
jgi:hypothetical protein